VNKIDALASFEPQEEDGDVHSACTAVAVLPDSFLDDLRRVKAEEPTTSRYKVLPESDLASGDAPTLPPPPQRGSRVRALNATISAALKAAAAPPPPLDVSAFLTRPAAPEPPPLPAIAVPAPSVAPVAAIPIVEIELRSPVARGEVDEERWVDVALAVTFALVLILTAGTIAVALLR
jgi:hypothetical protein